jgi:hypothetical protein
MAWLQQSGKNYNSRMLKAAGIVLIALGVMGLAISAIVLLRIPFPIVLLSHVGISGFHIHPVQGPISSLLLLIVGIVLFRRPTQASST